MHIITVKVYLREKFIKPENVPKVTYLFHFIAFGKTDDANGIDVIVLNVSYHSKLEQF